MKKVVSILLLGLFLTIAAYIRTSAPDHQLPTDASVYMPQQTKYIALTFDDGPHPIYTDRIVDTLLQYDAKGTFFVLGSRISDHLPQLQHIRNSGSMIANHTWDHLDLTTLSAERLAKQIGSVYGSIRSLCGCDPWLVRPPYGFADKDVCRNCPYPIISWSVDTLDWAWLDARRVTDHILTHAADGDI
ncbi:MAG: polysaccharide deacetylase family protein, partial [Clostridia bacterium]|nr:polysaccharide deacetylase family protein [Clostridia bacterium]